MAQPVLDQDSIPAGWGYVHSAYRRPSNVPPANISSRASTGTIDVFVKQILAEPWLAMAVTTQDVMRKWGLAKSQAQYVVKRARRAYRQQPSGVIR